MSNGKIGERKGRIIEKKGLIKREEKIGLQGIPKKGDVLGKKRDEGE
jgi:hypothetical protein